MTLEQILREEIGQLVGIADAVAPDIAAASRSWWRRAVAFLRTWGA